MLWCWERTGFAGLKERGGGDVMVREVYHKALKALQDEVLDMGKMVSQAIQDSIQALQTRDIEASKEIIKKRPGD